MITKTGRELLIRTALEKIAATRYKEVLTTLSDDSRARLAHIAKPLDQELAGIRKGTENLIARAGYTMRAASTEQEIRDVIGSGGAMTNHNSKTVLYLDPNMLKGGRKAKVSQKDVPFYDTARKNWDYVFNTLLRHEAYEADENAKAEKKGVYPQVRVYSVQNMHTPSMKKLRSNMGISDSHLEHQATDDDLINSLGGVEEAKSYLKEPIGDHVNLNVLAKETKFLNRSFHSDKAGTIKNRRRRFGEADILANNAGLDRGKGDIYSSSLPNKDYKNMASIPQDVLFHDIFKASNGTFDNLGVFRSTLNMYSNT